MIVQIHLTDDEIKEFFDGLGYLCQEVEVPHCSKRTHGSGEIDMIPTLAVEVNGQWLKANSLMNEYAKMNVLRPATCANVNIDQAARNIAKYDVLRVNHQ